MAPTLEVIHRTSERDFAAAAAAAADPATAGKQLKQQQQPSSVAPTPFQHMLDQIDRVFQRAECTSSVDVDELWRILEDYHSNPSDWSKYAHYQLDKHKRNLVYEHPKYNVMVLTWGPGTRSCIHDHAGSHCFMKILDGELFESRFAWPSDDRLETEMCCISEATMAHDDVLYINDKVGLHVVGNPNGNRTAASLHVYIPPYRKCKAFDQRTGQAIECSLNFYSKCGRVVNED